VNHKLTQGQTPYLLSLSPNLKVDGVIQTSLFRKSYIYETQIRAQVEYSSFPPIRQRCLIELQRIRENKDWILWAAKFYWAERGLSPNTYVPFDLPPVFDPVIS
jgi:hypothetical protein